MTDRSKCACVSCVSTDYRYVFVYILFSIRIRTSWQVFIDGTSYRAVSIPSRTLYFNLSLIFCREMTGIHWWDIISVFYTCQNTLSQSQPYFFLSGDDRYSLMGHYTGILYLPEHVISISAFFFVGGLLCLLFLPPNILFIVGLLSTFSHSPISVCWHIITLTGHRKSIGVNY